MANIHATALVDPSVKLGAKVEIGPFCVIGPGVELGDGVVVHPHAVITGRTSLGAECKVFPFACLGKAPQDIKYHDEPRPSSESTSPSIQAPPAATWRPR